MEFTTQQTAAIEKRNKNILVSASAGSGKTRVLVERVLQRLLAGDNVDEFLIVTFTEAAAAEMKERLEKALRQAVAESEGSQRAHLMKQLRLLKVANISTLHAFALHLIEQYHYTIDLDPQFRLADTAERNLVMQQIMDQVLERKYQQADADFLALVKQFTDDRGSDESLSQAVFKLFDFAMARPDTNEWLDQLPLAYQITQQGDSQDNSETLATLYDLIIDSLDDLVHAYQMLLEQLPVTDDTSSQNRRADLDDELAQIMNLKTQLQAGGDWDALRVAFFAVPFNSWGGKGRTANRKWEADEKQAWKQVTQARSDLKSQFKNLGTKFMVLDQAGLQVATAGAKQGVQALVELTKTFAEVYLADKKERKVFDFNDLEHFALAIVQQPTIAQKLREQYVEIMVDEYQDTNYLQETIVQALARANNVFQVGDIKQSIYKFRQADPQLFAHKMQTYVWRQDDNELITLAENFRSQPNVTNFINYLFEQLMSLELGDVEYAGDTKLIAGADYYPKDLPKQAELMLYFNEESENEGAKVEQSVIESLELNATDALTGSTGQIWMLGQKIKQLMADHFQIFDREQQVERDLTWDDMTILVPSRTQNPQIIEIFKTLDIPLTVQGSGNYFQTLEISIMLDYLRLIDNPYQDIPLAAVLRSPMYQVDENGLAWIRVQAPDEAYFTAVQKFAQGELPDEIVTDVKLADAYKKNQTKVKTFLKDLAQFHVTAVQNQLVPLIGQIYQTTGWLDYVGGLPGGVQRQANLHALYERAASYQKTNFTGLYQFNRYIVQLQKTSADDIGEADANEATNTVHLMTIHGSKGLEFPVVFLLNTTKMFNQTDQQGHLILEREAGIGLQYFDRKHHVKLTPPQYLKVQRAIQKADFAEQLRVLYVALTRAEQQLFLVGTYKNLEDLLVHWELSSKSTTGVSMLDANIRLSQHSFMDLMGMAITRHPQFGEKLQPFADRFDVEVKHHPILIPTAAFEFQLNFQTVDDIQNFQPVPTNTEAEVVAEQHDEIQLAPAEVKNYFEFEYPYEMATRTTSYQSVSEVKRVFEDPDLAEGRGLADHRLNNGIETGQRLLGQELKVPKFMNEMATKPTSVSRGTAAHLVLQKINLRDGAPTKQDFQTLIQQLVQDGLIEPTLEHLLPVTQMVEFFKRTSLGKQLVANVDTVQREVPFSMLIRANQLYQNFNGDERVLIHGIMDGVVTVNDEIWLFDYKTDYINPHSDGQALLKARYGGQLNIYGAALTAMGYAKIRKFIVALSNLAVYEFKD
ncbi:helicase-exonuclease AddAB subunit AddA [Weissella kandleri]|uniref:helicase-exonuclease AddAB subunit AddA n=1 Tax=Weissella kandleri TaxID=1616 RepID=UPI00387E97AC